MTTIHRPQDGTTIQGPPRQYPIILELLYKATSKQGPLYGFGQTRMISSQDITFTPSGGLKPGMAVEIAVAWPPLPDGRIRLQLVVEATIIGSQDGVAEARIIDYHFRTRGFAEHSRAVGPEREPNHRAAGYDHEEEYDSQPGPVSGRRRRNRIRPAPADRPKTHVGGKPTAVRVEGS